MDLADWSLCKPVESIFGEVVGMPAVNVGDGGGQGAVDIHGGFRHSAAFHPFLQVVNHDLSSPKAKGGDQHLAAALIVRVTTLARASASWSSGWWVRPP